MNLAAVGRTPKWRIKPRGAGFNSVKRPWTEFSKESRLSTEKMKKIAKRVLCSF